MNNRRYLIHVIKTNLASTTNIYYIPQFSVSVKPTLMEIPRVRILNEGYDTPDRQFPVETAIQLTCQGEVGSDQTKVRFNAMEGKIDLQNLFSFFFILVISIHNCV